MSTKKPPAESVRDTYYKRAQSRFGLSLTQIKEALAGQFDGFNMGKIKEYDVCLQEFADDYHTEVAMANMRAKLRNRVKESVDAVPCTILGCTGARKFDAIWGWICSEGGLRHKLAVRAAEKYGDTPEIHINVLEQLDTGGILVDDWIKEAAKTEAN